MTTTRAVRTLGFMLSGVLSFAVAAAISYPFNARATFEFGTDPPRMLASGFYPAERTRDGQTFAWMGDSFDLRLRDLDRSHDWTVVVRLNAGRPAGAAPSFVPSVDGVAAAAVAMPADGYAEERIAMPARPGVRGATIHVAVTPTFVPSKEDPRQLGAQVDWIRLEQGGWLTRLPSRGWPSWLAGALAGAVIGAMGLPLGASVWLLAVTAFGLGSVTTWGVGPFVDWPWPQMLLTTAITTFGAAAVVPLGRAGGRVVVVVTMMAALLELAVLSHPQMPFGDSVFHAHRFQDVLAGQYFFTSVAPGNYLFPYPVGLYVFASPLAKYSRNVFDNVALLRMVVVAADAVAAAAIYRVMIWWRDDPAEGAAAVVAYHVIPLGFSVIATGNLTNMFAQSWAIGAFVAMAGLGSTALRSGASTKRAAWTLALGVCELAAFLSHTSSFAVLATQAVAIAIVLVVARDRGSRRVAIWLGAVSVAAILLAVAIYYAHFMDTYRATFTRAAAETGHATAAAGGRTPFMRLVDVPRLVHYVYGWAIVVLFVGGLAAIAHGGYRSPIRRIVATWLGVCVFFLVAGIVTPVDMRHYLAAMPAVAIVVAAGAVEGWRRGGVWRLAVCAMTLAAAWIGVTAWRGAFMM
jgi:hypothetical protein